MTFFTFSAFSLMTMLLRPLVGRRLDWFGRRPFFVLSLAGYALALIGFAYADQVWAIIAARVMQGVASSFMWLVAYATTADVAVRKQRGRAFGNVIQASTRGSDVEWCIGQSGNQNGWYTNRKA